MPTPPATRPALDLLADLRARRDKLGLSLGELSERTDMAPSNLSRLFSGGRGARGVSMSTYQRVAAAMGAEGIRWEK